MGGSEGEGTRWSLSGKMCAGLRSPQIPTQSGACGPVSAHTMHASTWRCRGRTDIEALDGRGIGDGADGRPRGELPQILHTGVDLSTNVFGVVLLEGYWRHNAAC